MEPMPGYAQSYPPPPPPQRSRKGLWIGLAIGAVVLCLCCIVVVGVYFFRQNIPYISNFFPSPTPTGLSYNNPAAGISLTYPANWQYSESGDATSGYLIVFASSADVLNDSSNAPQTGAAMAILTNVMKTSDVSFTVNAGSMGDVVDYIATNYFTNLSQGQNLRTFTLSGYPAASGLYTATNATGSPSVAYLIAVLRNDEIIMLFGVCPQTEWTQHQPTFDSIVNSASIVTP
ncbi:MAG TPA: hypothetical protein VII93_05160 [Anaerolineales bacterium]